MKQYISYKPFKNRKARTNKLSIWILSSILIAIIAGFVAYYIHTSATIEYDKGVISSLRDQLTSSKNELSATQSQLKDAQGQVVYVQDQLNSSNNKLSFTQSQLKEAQKQVVYVQDQLTSSNTELSVTQSQLKETQGQLTTLRSECTSIYKTLDLYKETWGSVVASDIKPSFEDADIVNQPTAINKTWAQVNEFILSDKTDRNAYIPGIYTCGEFARDVHNNAERAGIRAAYVAIKFSGSWHACNAFKTTDKGLVFIDCTGLEANEAGPSIRDKTVTVKLGTYYTAKSLIRQSGWKATWGNLGQILDVQIYW